MRIDLILELAQEPGALVRTLAAIERRGYTLSSVRFTAERVALGIETLDRPPDLLVRQIERLLCVRTVRLGRDDPREGRLGPGTA
jgi:acetolactate synthase regulatory subunit